MADKTIRFGSDLRLLGNLEAQYDRNRGSDLFTIQRPQTSMFDLLTLQGAENLQQALLLRFLTPVGEMAILGHPDYGSRLSELIGELNNDTNRNRAKIFVLQSLAAEPRVQRVLTISVTQNASDRTRMDIAVSLLSIDSDTPINLVFPFFLQGGPTP